jgi:hypothetical protein
LKPLKLIRPNQCGVYRHFDIEQIVVLLRITDALKVLMALKKGIQAQ